MKLFIEGLGEVGVGSVVEVCPQGKWLGVAIPINPWVYVLLRPHLFNSEAQHYKLNPSQRGLSTLSDAVERTILWTVTDVVKSSGDVPLDTRPYICQDQWVGLEVHYRDSVGVLISSGRIMCWKENDHFQDGTLGENHVGVTILDIFVDSKEDLMTHARWNILDCWFPEGRSLKETVDHFASLPNMQDPFAYLGGRAKAPYRFIVRIPSLQQRNSLYVQKTADEEIRKVSSEKCYGSKCCQFFLQEKTLRVRQLFWVKSFEERCQYGIAVDRQLHAVGVKWKRKYITLEGVEVCGTVRYIFHGIPKSTYHNYIEKYKEGVFSSMHGN